MTAPRVAPLTMEPWINDFGDQEVDNRGLPCWLGYHPEYPGDAKWFSCPYGAPGDRLWVRETWRHGVPLVYYKATDGSGSPTVRWRPSIHMPRWASRISLDVVSVRVERLQDISEADCCAELGAPREWPGPGPEPYKRNLRGSFAERWNLINGKRGYGWSVNPWVWVVEFKKVQP